MPAIRLLEDLLSSRARIRVLRVLLTRPSGHEWTGRELASLSGASVSQTSGALHGLLTSGVVSARSVGQAFLWRLNPSHVLMPPLRDLFVRESEVTKRMESDVRRKLRGTAARKIWLFGSVALGIATSRSDVDILVEAPDPVAMDKIRGRLNRMSSDFLQRYGVPLSAQVYLPSQLEHPDNPDLLKAIREEGVLIEQ
jgi:predicted nucleotidyltransferase